MHQGLPYSKGIWEGLGMVAHRKRGSGGGATSVQCRSGDPGVAWLASRAPSYRGESPGPVQELG
jgi:hypothetical protein